VLRTLTASVAAIALRVVSLFMSSPCGWVAITIKDPGRVAFMPAGQGATAGTSATIVASAPASWPHVASSLIRPSIPTASRDTRAEDDPQRSAGADASGLHPITGDSDTERTPS
jgi:hypothetical protein